MIVTLENLLNEIALEPVRSDQSRKEKKFFKLLDRLKESDSEMYVRFVMRYNEVQNSKYDTTT